MEGLDPVPHHLRDLCRHLVHLRPRSQRPLGLHRRLRLRHSRVLHGRRLHDGDRHQRPARRRRLLPVRRGLELPFYLGILASGPAAGVLAVLIGIPTLRLRADYLAITTIGAAEALRRVAINERDLVNGTRGMIGIPAPLRDVVSTRSDYYNLLFLGLALLVLAIIYVAIERGIRSPWGRVLRAVREDEMTGPRAARTSTLSACSPSCWGR